MTQYCTDYTVYKHCCGYKPPADQALKMFSPRVPNLAGASMNSTATGRTYTLFANSADITTWAPKNWQNAEMACRNQVPGGHLASFATDADWAAVSSLAQFANAQYSTTRLWVGLNNLRSSGYTFTDGSATTYSYIPAAAVLNLACKASACFTLNVAAGVVTKTLQHGDCDADQLAFICVGSAVNVSRYPSCWCSDLLALVWAVRIMFTCNHHKTTMYCTAPNRLKRYTFGSGKVNQLPGISSYVSVHILTLFGKTPRKGNLGRSGCVFVNFFRCLTLPSRPPRRT